MTSYASRLPLLLLLTSLVSTGAWGAPVVTSIEGPTSAGELVVRGSGFGRRPTPGPKLWDTIVNQPAYKNVSSGVSVPSGQSYPWQINTTNRPGSVVFSEMFPRHRGVKFHYRTSSFKGDLDWPVALGGNHPPANQSRIYASFWVRPDSSVDDSGHSSKFVRVWDREDATGTRSSWTQMHFTYNDWTGTPSVSWTNWGGAASKWNRLEVFVDANKHTYTARTNGQVRHHVTDWKKDPSQSGLGLNIARLGWDSGGVSPPHVDVSFGEIYVDTSPARVEICSQTTWGACIDSEIQIATSWSDNEIRFVPDPRALASRETLYLYVVDDADAASQVGVKLSSSTRQPNSPGQLVIE